MSSARTAVDETSNGAFVRTAAGFRNQIAPGTEFEPEAGRYHLYISYACPWADRCLAVLYMKVGRSSLALMSVQIPNEQHQPAKLSSRV